MSNHASLSTQSQNAKESYEYVRHTIRRENTIYTILRHVSASGMSRVISFYTIKNNKLLNLDYYIANICNYKRTEKYGGGLHVRGVGMDMGYNIVYQLSYQLFGEGYGLKHSEFNPSFR